MNRLYTSLFCLLATTLCSVFATAELQSVPTLEFDASDANSLTIIDGGVSTWKHKSKNTINFDIANEKKSFPGPDTPAATAANPANRPTLQTRSNNTLRPALYFDGVDDALVVPVELTSPTWTLIVVAAPFAPIAGGGICSGTIEGGHDYDPGFTVDTFQSGQLFDQISVEGAGRDGGQRDQMQSSFPSGGFHVIVVTRHPDRVDLHIDGILEGSRPAFPADTKVDTFRIGARYYAGSEKHYFHGEIAYVALYNVSLNDTERVAREKDFQVSETERAAGEQLVRELKTKPRMGAPELVQSWPSLQAYLAANTIAPDPTTLPIRTDLREAITFSSRHLNSLYNADKDNEPYFYVNREADGTGKMHHSVNIGIPHVVGRCLLGSMAAELMADVPFPDSDVAILERYLRLSFDNPEHLNSYIDPERANGRFVEFHNMREGLYGLWALIAGRDSDWARDTAHQMLVTLDHMTDDQGRWSPELAKQIGILDHSFGIATPNTARIIEPLLAYHDETKDPLALKLAALYAREGLKALFNEDGTFAPMDRSSGHVHSITSSLAGITDYAARTRDEAMLAQCRQIMDAGIPGYFSSWGWGDEVFPEHPANVIGRGEINQTADVVRAGLILGNAGFTDYYEIAERYLRSMLLPTQHREEELRLILHDKPSPTIDAERDTVRRSIGGYAMQLPNDRMRKGDWPISTLDITSGAVHAMSECYRQRTTIQDGAYRMNLLFDFEDDTIAIDSELSQRGVITIQAKQKVRGFNARIPSWVARKSVRITIGQKSIPSTFLNGFVTLPPLDAGDTAQIEFDISCKIEKELVDGTTYTTTWLGNQLIDIKPRGAESPLPF